MGHQHHAHEQERRPYEGPIRKELPDGSIDEVPEAREGYLRIDKCNCGAVRRVNVNGRMQEAGKWEEPGG